MTSYCSECVVHWWPHHAPSRACPECGARTSYSLHEVSYDAGTRYESAVAAQAMRERHHQFERYYAQRQWRHERRLTEESAAGAPNPRHQRAPLNGPGRLSPSTEPHQAPSRPRAVG
jgi:hypothetical protein